jgi:iron-sulfur cluster repair protein YtfE (RIC family)
MTIFKTELSPTATRLIRREHTHVLHLFHKLTPDLAAPVREAVTRKICTALEVHAQLEEEIFYPALRDTGVNLRALDHSVEEHDEMRRRIERVRSLPGGEQPQIDAMNALMNAVMHHVAEEETVVLPAAEQRLAGRLSELGARMTNRRLELVGPHGADSAANLAGGAAARTALLAVGLLAAVALLLGRRRSWA